MKIYFQAPNNASAVVNPLGLRLVDQNVHSLEVNPSRLLLAARLLQAQAQLAADDAALIIWWLDREEQDALLYGVDASGATDSLAALNAVTRAAVAAGGATVKLPRRGLVQVSGQWLVGKRFVNEGEVGYGLGQFSSYDTAPSYVSSARDAASAMPTVSVDGRGSVLWWGGSEPSVETATLYYGMPSGSQAHIESGFVKDLCIAGPAAFSGGALQSPDTSAVPTTKVSGLFSAGTSAAIQRITARECRRGVVMSGCYWSRVEKATAWHCGRGFVLLAHNAAEGSNLTASYCAQGFELAGQGSTFRRLATEQCGRPSAGLGSGSLWVPECDNLTIDGTYFETVGALKDYTYRFGLPANLALYSEQFDNSAAWGYVSSGTPPAVLANQADAPDGTHTADQITFAEAVPDGGHWDYLAQSIPVTAGKQYTASLWLKAGTCARMNLQARITGGSGDVSLSCALTTSWQRFELPFTPGTGATAVTFTLGDSGIGPFTIQTGTLFAWGAMVNPGGFAHPYRPSAASAQAAGNGCYYPHLSNAHMSSEQGVSMSLINAQLLADNVRNYDQGAEAQRARLDGASSIIATHSSIPINVAGSDSGYTVQTTDAALFSFAWIYTTADSQNIAAGRSTYKDLTGYVGVRLNDEISVSIPTLPAGWLARAECVAFDGTNGTVRVTLLNGTGATADAPTMTGVMHVRHTGNVS